MPRKRKSGDSPDAPAAAETVTSIKYPAKRRHIPPAGLEAQGRIAESPRLRYEYNPHLPPVLRFSNDPARTDQLPELLQIARQRALSDTEVRMLTDALRRNEPWLEWSGKREKPWFEVDPVPIHIHERVSTQAILRVLAREEVQRSLFADPELEYHEAVKFYLHDVDWANRMILGDSLQVMASLARREDLAGKVQMIYIDPPYGIKFSSNFQPQLGQRDVKDREQDLTREPEMVKAYRDTWTLGIHSYLAYLRDRLAMARELLSDSGSIFVQISDENLHRVRCVMDEVFGVGNFTSLISYKTTQSAGAKTLDTSCDYILWYAKDAEQIRFRPLFKELRRGEKGATRYDFVENLNTGETYRITKEDDKVDESSIFIRLFTDQGLTSRGEGSETTMGKIVFEGEEYWPTVGHWRTRNENVQKRLIPAGRVLKAGKTLRFKKCFDDFGCLEITNLWDDVGGGISSRDDPKIFVVQTSATIIQRCLLMTTDPGDLVLDPTCGSGTTAYVAEQWGRRWITIDTSRVALALAKQRLLTARFPYYGLRQLNPQDLQQNPNGTWLKDGGYEQLRTFNCKTVPHITLKSIARNTSLDPIFGKHEPILEEDLAALNAELRATVTNTVREKLAAKLNAKVVKEGVRAVTDADCRRWLLPGTKPFHVREKKAARLRDRIPLQDEWREWEVPFDTDPEWPAPLAEALVAYRAAWRNKMDEVNACIAANAETEELVDKPEEVKGVVRVSGPFTVESVIALEEGPDTPIGGVPEEMEAFDAGDGAGDIAVSNAEAHLDKIIRLLKASGVDFPGNRNIKFARIEPITGGNSLIHAEGEWMNGDQQERLAAVSIGPETGNLTAFQVEDVIRAANRKGYDDVVFAAYGFDASAQAAIEEASHPKLRMHMALIRPDVAMDALLKTQPGSQLFTVFSAPRVKGPEKQKDGRYVVEVEGMDVYDPVSNALYPTDKDRIAAWFLDSDYDGRTFCICQAFFPDRSKWNKLARALGDKGVIDPKKFEALSGLKSLPFPRPARLKPGKSWRVAVKVIDPRGNEGLRVLEVIEGVKTYA